jgi:protein-S-isoprenylcysteine O-methyltransferase Ste14
MLQGISGRETYLIIGTYYSKFIEERELWIRFGQECEEYREKTPFLIPRF